MTVTKTLLYDLFKYEDGILYRKIGRRNKYTWKPTGSLDKGGYLTTGLNGKVYKTHRLIFLMHHNYLPEFIDHIDGNRTNNNIDNLRAATKSQNARNHKVYVTSKSKYSGVTYNARAQKWAARAQLKGKRYFLGYYHVPEDAHGVVLTFKQKHYEGFVRG